MLVLSRQKDEIVVIDGSIEVMIIKVVGDRVYLGVEAPKNISVHRKEIQDRIDSGIQPAAAAIL